MNSSQPDISHIHQILFKVRVRVQSQFIEHNQPVEFIEVFKMQKQAAQTTDLLKEIGKTYLHIAVEHQSAGVVQYLLFEEDADPNQLTHNTKMAPLHIAASRMYPSIIELLLLCKRTQIEIMSELHGTPLHVACLTSSVKIVQQLLLNGANVSATNPKGKLPRELTNNKRILYLLDKEQNKCQPIHHDSNSADSNGQMEAFEMSFNPDDMGDQETMKKQVRMIKEPLVGQKSSNAHIQAIQFIKEFEQSQIELVPVVRGGLLCMSICKSKQKGPDLKYLVLDPLTGELAIFQQEKFFLEQNSAKAEIIKLSTVLCATHSFNAVLARKGIQAIELTFQSETLQLFIGCYDTEQLKRWLDGFSKGKKFSDWLSSIRYMLQKHNKKIAKNKMGLLNDHLVFKLCEIVEFCESFCGSESYEIQNLSQKQAQANELCRKTQEQQLMKRQADEVNQISWLKKSGVMVDLTSSVSSTAVTVTQPRTPLKPVKFADFDVFNLLGEGSFGKVYRVRHKESGKCYAMKSMQKQFLISNNQIKYAVTEADIMKALDHPYVLRLEYTFQTPDHLHMVMELIENGDLSQQLDSIQFVEEPLARFITAELILAMQYVHSKHVLFRDLKPENILIDRQGHIRLADFGLAKQGNENHKQIAVSFCGSPAYLAPEMLSRAGVSESGDVYQIGVVLYEMLVGIPPYYNENIQKLYENIQKGKLKIPKYLSKNSRNVLVKVLNQDPKKRPTMEQLKTDPFFDSIDWHALSLKKLAPPQVLGKLPPKKQETSQAQDLQFMFEQGVSKHKALQDTDYEEHNRTYNRVKNYSFERN